MKKIIVTFSLLLCALLTLSGCTSNQEEKTSVKQQLEKENIKVTIEESKDFSDSEIEKAMQVVIDKIKKIPAQPLEIAYLKVDQDSKDKNSKNPKKYHLNLATKFKTGDKNVPDTMNPNTTYPWHYHLESDDKNTWEVYKYGF